ncbi:hypothetical protein BLOT_008790 [Blomia tropicalis]|nr:hypothetical protein BLOT_008790 [Blomia tropicalis]
MLSRKLCRSVYRGGPKIKFYLFLESQLLTFPRSLVSKNAGFALAGSKKTVSRSKISRHLKSTNQEKTGKLFQQHL